MRTFVAAQCSDAERDQLTLVVVVCLTTPVPDRVVVALRTPRLPVNHVGRLGRPNPMIGTAVLEMHQGSFVPSDHLDPITVNFTDLFTVSFVVFGAPCFLTTGSAAPPGLDVGWNRGPYPVFWTAVFDLGLGVGVGPDDLDTTFVFGLHTSNMFPMCLHDREPSKEGLAPQAT